jgi:hypothetical protein
MLPRSLSWWLAACLLLASLLTGCAKKGYARYVPSAAAGREAVEFALKEWQAGQPVGTLTSHSPPLQVVDSCRRPGQLLAGYTILGEAPCDGPRCFAVRLKHENPNEELKVRYVVVGIDPLWVMRFEDYEMMKHWECPMPTTAREGSRRAAPR